VLEPATEAARDARGTVAGHAFGVAIHADASLPGLIEGPGGAPGIATEMELVGDEVIDAAWSGAEPTRVRDVHYDDGSLMMGIDRDAARGYRIDTPGHGLFLVAGDGRRLLASIEPEPAWRWQLVVYAQVLPLVATLQHLELMHSSAVAVDGRAYAFLAPAGTGKSSVATHLIAQGATFFTDDALAIDLTSDTLVAHPGARFANLQPHEMASLPAQQRSRLGRVLGESEKVHVEPDGPAGPLPLAGLYFLTRKGDEPLGIEPGQADAGMFLANVFIEHVRSPERMANQLDVCSRLARGVPFHRVKAPAVVRASDVAAAILADIAGTRT
jgi:hypothetical protein